MGTIAALEHSTRLAALSAAGGFFQRIKRRPGRFQIFVGAMTLQTQTTLERAFELAKAGNCRTVTELRLKLRSEGFDVDQITGPRLLKQLNGILGQAQTDETVNAPPE